MKPPLKWEIGTIIGRPTVIEITLSGYITKDDLRGPYGTTLAQKLAYANGPLALLFSAQALTGVELALPTAHAELLVPHMSRIVAVATISDRAFVRFGMASASLVLNRKFQTFETREEALSWFATVC